MPPFCHYCNKLLFRNDRKPMGSSCLLGMSAAFCLTRPSVQQESEKAKRKHFPIFNGKKLYFLYFYGQAPFSFHLKQEENLHIKTHLFADFNRATRQITVCFPQERTPFAARNTFFLRKARHSCPHTTGFHSSFHPRISRKQDFRRAFSRMFFYLKQGMPFL